MRPGREPSPNGNNMVDESQFAFLSLGRLHFSHLKIPNSESPRSGRQHKVFHPSRDARLGTPAWGVSPRIASGKAIKAREVGGSRIISTMLSGTAITRFAGSITFLVCDLGLTPQGRGPQPSISAGVEDFMLTSAPRTLRIRDLEVTEMQAAKT